MPPLDPLLSMSDIELFDEFTSLFRTYRNAEFVNMPLRMQFRAVCTEMRRRRLLTDQAIKRFSETTK